MEWKWLENCNHKCWIVNMYICYVLIFIILHKEHISVYRKIVNFFDTQTALPLGYIKDMQILLWLCQFFFKFQRNTGFGMAAHELWNSLCECDITLQCKQKKSESDRALKSKSKSNAVVDNMSQRMFARFVLIIYYGERRPFMLHKSYSLVESVVIVTASFHQTEEQHWMTMFKQQIAYNIKLCCECFDVKIF